MERYDSIDLLLEFLIRDVNGEGRGAAIAQISEVYALGPAGLTVKAHAFTGSARAAIEGAGGKCVELSKTTQEPVEA